MSVVHIHPDSDLYLLPLCDIGQSTMSPTLMSQDTSCLWTYFFFCWAWTFLSYWMLLHRPAGPTRSAATRV